MGLLSWIILGLIAGVIADFLMGGGFGLIGSIILGVVGAIVGGYVASLLGVGTVAFNAVLFQEWDNLSSISGFSFGLD